MSLQAVMESNVTGLCQAALGERTPLRENLPNGCQERKLEIRLGTMVQAIRKLRQGSFFSNFLEPRRRWEQSFLNVATET